MVWQTFLHNLPQGRWESEGIDWGKIERLPGLGEGKGIQDRGKQI